MPRKSLPIRHHLLKSRAHESISSNASSGPGSKPAASTSAPTWEPDENMTNCSELVDQFHSQHPDMPGP
ncbi:hypothetical protein BGX29_004689, partial [Mortierella sp. GBA35]